MLQRAVVVVAANLCLALSATESNYFMGEIDLAGLILQPNAFPIGVCSMTGAGFTSLSFGVYTCDSVEQVTFADYGSDDTCSSTPLSTTTYALNDSLSEGDMYSFYCGGEDNYQVAQTCSTPAEDDIVPPLDGGDVCCQDQATNVFALFAGGCLPYTTATGVCQDTNMTVEVNSVSIPIYSRVECDGVDSYVESYALSDCSDDPLDRLDASSIDACSFFDTLEVPPGLGSAALYRLLSSCVADSVELTNGTYCPAADTMEPTMEPTATPTADTMGPTAGPSEEPTEEPTMEPSTSPTMEPTPVDSDDGDSEEETDSAFAVCSTVAAFSAIVSTMAVLF